MTARVQPPPAAAKPHERGSVIPLLTLSWKQALLLAGGATAAFHLAYAFPPLSFLIAIYLLCLFQLSALPSPRKAFYFGVSVGYAVYAPFLSCFCAIRGLHSFPSGC